MARGREIAPPHRRVLAGVVDAAVFLPLLGGVGWAGFKLYPRYRKWRGPADLRRLSTTFPRRLRVGLWVGGYSGKVALRNWRTPGMRLLRIRTVDAVTGGPVSVRSVVIREAMHAGQNQALKRIWRPAEQRRQQRQDAIRPQLEKIRREHSADKEAQQSAMMKLYKDTNTNGLGSCVPALLGLVVAFLPAFVTPHRQTLPELVAGTIVVMDS